MIDTAMTRSSLDELCINAIRILSMDAVQAANSGHPGTPMGLASLAYVLWTRHLRHNPADPTWVNRDRFVLSCGHASMLLYSLLYLSGYDLSLDDIKNFRQWGSTTPGHPEYGLTDGVETTTGPLGQGIANAVGMALAEASLAAQFNHTGHYVVDHHTYFICSDGDLMEGVSHEAASLAGHLKLGKLIGFYDNNNITIEGERSLADSEDVKKRFESYGWSVLCVEDGNDLDAIDDAIDAARAELLLPSLVIVKTHIGYGSPNKQDSEAAHGAPLGVDEVALTRKKLGWEWEEAFYVPPEVKEEWERCGERGSEFQDAWKRSFKKYKSSFPAETEELMRRLEGKLPSDWQESLPNFAQELEPQATRLASGKTLNALAPVLPELIGGSADLGPSNNTTLEDFETFSKDKPTGRNLHFGVREHAMGAIQNGMALHGGLIPYGGTFLIFSDYMRPAIRLAALMGLGTIYVFTHDSIGLGEDGPTHQPIETLSALRAIPGLCVIRPADATETVLAWKAAIDRRHGPTALVLTRQKVPTLLGMGIDAACDLSKGAYVAQRERGDKLDLILLGSGSELSLCTLVRELLQEEGFGVRVVSMPSHELFEEQNSEYQETILPSHCRRRIAVEAGHPMSWYRWVGDGGDIVGIERFGASAPAGKLFAEYGFSKEAIVTRAKRLLAQG